MSSAIVFEYRHKKFDHGKRAREDDYSSSENGTNSIPLDLSDSSNTPVPSNPPKRRRVKSTENKLPQSLQGVNLTKVIGRRKIECSFDGPVLSANENNIAIKTELIETNNDTAAVTRRSSLQKRRRTQSTAPLVKIEQESYPDVKIKEELIELGTTLPEIPREAYEDICKFRSNMVRTFPKKERSAKDQERRDKNTYACRKSRRVKKIEQVAVEEEYKKFKDANIRVAEYAIRSAAYFKQLMNRSAEDEVIVID